MRVSSRRLRAAMDAFEGAFPRKSFRPSAPGEGDHRRARRRARPGRGHRAAAGVRPSMRDDERPGVEGLIARYREERAAEDPASRPSSQRIEEEGFEERLVAYVAKHTGVRLDGSSPGRRRPEVAKPRPVPGLDPDRRLRPNARRVLAVRIDEVYAYDGLVADPANVTELHDMRIACKRLRYLLEIFAHRVRGRPRALHRRGQGLQDLLGDIHDCDVQIPMLEDHLAWLNEREGGAARRLVAEPRRAVPAGAPPRAARTTSARSQRELEIGRRGDERLGRPRADRPPPPGARRALRPVHR